MDFFKINCPQCGQPLEVPDSMACDTVACPTCNGVLELSKLIPRSRVETTCPQEGEAPLDAEKQGKLKKTGGRIALACVAGLVAVAGIVFFGMPKDEDGDEYPQRIRIKSDIDEINGKEYGIDRIEARDTSLQTGGSAKFDDELVDQLFADMIAIPGKRYSICKFEVTQKQWEAVMGENPSMFKGLNLPVTSVTWDACQDFIRKLNARPAVKASGRVFRLPTVNEWKYACCNGNVEKNPYIMLGQSEWDWYGENSGGNPHPVGQLRPNDFGLYDMLGNVQEWTSTADGNNRVCCGGSFDFFAENCELGRRVWSYGSACRFRDLGFRLVAQVAENAKEAAKSESRGLSFVAADSAQSSLKTAQEQYNLGLAYLNGDGAVKDEKKAVELFRKAAEQGYALAQYKLGWCYEYGRGVGKDYEQAVAWYRKAAEQGYALAQSWLGWCYKDGKLGVGKDDDQAVAWFRKAAEQGCAEAQCGLGLCYQSGRGVGAGVDYEQAAAWFRKAAEQGVDGAQFILGHYYYYGEGVGMDLEEAVAWYRKAAEQGHAKAQFWLGKCYEKGRGVEKDLGQAVAWYRKAAEQGDADAQGNLKRLGAQVEDEAGEVAESGARAKSAQTSAVQGMNAVEGQ